MSSFFMQADDVLRRRPWTSETALLSLTAQIIIFGVVYGSAMGTFGGLFGDRMWQVAYSALKVPLLLLATFLISLPSYFVLNTLFGLRSDFVQAVRGLVATQAGLAIILAALAPFTILWYVSSGGYHAAILFNALMFAVASFGAQWLLRGYYKPLIERSRRHRWLLRSWIILYAFVGIQMGWILRPFVGSPGAPVQFFREETWGNAYVIVARIIWNVFFRDILGSSPEA